MLRFFFFISVGALIVSAMPSCTDHPNENAGQELTISNEVRRDSLENQLVNTLDEINKNLDMIREKHGLISQGGEWEGTDKKDIILKNISLINSLLEDNQRKIAELTKLSKMLGKEKSALARVADQYKQRIEKQEKEILYLKQQLALEEFKVADLNVKMDELQVNNELLQAEKEALIEANNQFDKDLNKAYFSYGTYEELLTKEIVEKKGVLAGSKKAMLSSKFNQNRSYFSELDLREVTNVPYRGSKARLLTMHPEGSYVIKENGTEYGSLEITDKAAFWSTSRFLVIQVK